MEDQRRDTALHPSGQSGANAGNRPNSAREHEDAASAFPRIYDELRSIARSHWRRVRDKDVLQTTALVHEVYLRMNGGRDLATRDRSHGLAIAARTLHRVLVDHVRATRAAKRGGRWARACLTSDLVAQESSPIDFLALEEGLARLGARNPRRADVVELRLFGGLSVEETAGVLGVSERTVKEDWAIARAFLVRELQPASGD